jgi:hypothetical protein
VESDGERFDQAEMARGKPVGDDHASERDSEEFGHGAISLHPICLVELARVGTTAAAGGALTAIGVGGDRNGHAFAEVGRRAAHSFNGRGDFMARHAGIRHERVLAAVGAEIGPAETDALDAKQDVILRELRRGTVFYVSLTGRVNDESFHAGGGD